MLIPYSNDGVTLGWEVKWGGERFAGWVGAIHRPQLLARAVPDSSDCESFKMTDQRDCGTLELVDKF